MESQFPAGSHEEGAHPTWEWVAMWLGENRNWFYCYPGTPGTLADNHWKFTWLLSYMHQNKAPTEQAEAKQINELSFSEIIGLVNFLTNKYLWIIVLWWYIQPVEHSWLCLSLELSRPLLPFRLRYRKPPCTLLSYMLEDNLPTTGPIWLLYT